MNQTLTKLLETPVESYSTLQRVLLGLSSSGKPDTNMVRDITFFDPTLNDSQKEAVKFALGMPELALLHGPPGTGKTYTLIELILQLLAQKQRILVCGPSNISVDNIVERLTATSPSTPIVRLGHPARLLPGVLNRSLEVLTRTSEAAGIVNDVRKEMDEKQNSIRKSKSGRERKVIYQDIKELRKEFREREGRCVENLVRESKVVLATLHGSGGHQIKNQHFDVLVIDEASQAMEPQCWVPIVWAQGIRKVVLAGDHLQLPPTVKGLDGKVDNKEDEKKRVKTLEEELGKLSLNEEEIKAAKKAGLDETMFDRLLGMYGDEVKRLLDVQYRMHETIMKFPSEELYDGKLVAAEGVKTRLLMDLEGVEETDDTKEPVVFFDTQGGDFPEKVEEDVASGKKSVLLSDSKSNDMEAAVVKMHVTNLINVGVKAEDIAVVTPYNAQLALLSSMLRESYPGLELGSIDGFQGREKEAVIVSLVRSNPEKEVGFLGEKRRLNGRCCKPISDTRCICHTGVDEARLTAAPMRS